MGADIDDDGDNEHSNIHIGELHWKTVDDSERGNPLSWQTTPSPSLKVEVDYYEDTDQSHIDALNNVEDTYALYDINVTYDIDEEITTSDLKNHTNGYGNPDPLIAPHSEEELEEIEKSYHDRDDDTVYLFITSEYENDKSALGKASSGGPGSPIDDTFGMAIFSDEMYGEMKFRQTVAHEVGHILHAGTNDDNSRPLDKLAGLEEVYSGNESTDETLERVTLYKKADFEKSETTYYWSIMAKGLPKYPASNYTRKRKYNYGPRFSVEELLTIETNNAVSESHEIIQ
jgi:hypothetical protein